MIDFDDDAHGHGVVYCQARHHVLAPEHWFDEALAYFDTYERVGERAGDEWFFRRRRLRSWYRQYFGHPEHGNERIDNREPVGPEPGAHADVTTFDAFWSNPPRHSI